LRGLLLRGAREGKVKGGNVMGRTQKSGRVMGRSGKKGEIEGRVRSKRKGKGRGVVRAPPETKARLRHWVYVLLRCKVCGKKFADRLI